MKKSVTTWYYNNLIVWFFIFPITIIGLSGIIACSESAPSVSEGKEALIKRLTEYHGYIGADPPWSNCLKVVSFDKTDGIPGEEAGVKVYLMEYSAQVEIICSPCSGSYNKNVKSFSTLQSVVLGQQGGCLFCNEAFKLGSKYEHTGKIRFKKTEKGWRVTEFPH